MDNQLPYMVLSLLILPSILNELYKVKNFKSHFFKNLSINFFQILDLSCSHITLKKLLKSFPRHIFSFQDIIKDRCGLVSHFLHMNVSSLPYKFCIDNSKNKSVVTPRISPIFFLTYFNIQMWKFPGCVILTL